MPDLATTGLPHYENSSAARNKYEPVYLNQYEILFTPPPILNLGSESMVITEQVKKVEGLPEITPLGFVEQYYKFAKRTYANAKPEDTTAEITIDFEVNITYQLDMYVYNYFRMWADKIFDPMTGTLGLKRDYTGSMQILIYNKAREIFRDFRFDPVYLIDPFNKMDLDYVTDDIYIMTVKFKADSWTEVRESSGVTASAGSAASDATM